jgi:hypothetical protein
MAYPWVKLWTEIIHDPKLGRLPEHVQLVFVKLMCVTGEHDAERTGALPPVDEMAWTLRMDEAQLEADLQALARVGMVHCTDGEWCVTNFATRQGPMTSTQRVAALRDRKHKAAYYEPEQATAQQQACNDDVTDVQRIVAQTRLDKTRLDEDVDVDQSAPVTGARDDDHRDPLTARFYGGLQRLGVMVSSQAQAQAYNEVIEDIRGHPQADEFVRQLFNEAAATTSGRITPRWFEVVVDRCLREGCMPGDKRAAKGRDAPTKGGTEHSLDEWAAIAAQFNGGLT